MTTPRRRRFVSLFGSMLVAASAVLANTSIAPVSPVDAAPKPPACTLVPELRGVTINQGVGNYTPLARGKETLVRLFLAMPTCAASATTIALTGGTLTVLNGATQLGVVSAPTPVPATPYPLINPSTTAPSKDSVGDPKFVVPGSFLAPAATTGRWTATFRATVNYQSKTSATAAPVNGVATFTTLTGSSALDHRDDRAARERASDPRRPHGRRLEDVREPVQLRRDRRRPERDGDDLARLADPGSDLGSWRDHQRRSPIHDQSGATRYPDPPES